MGPEGDLKQIWDADNAEEVKAAQDAYDRLIKKGYKAFAVKKSGDKGELITKFDPELEKIIMVPPISGG
jgi:hypothetical protein